MMQLEEDPEAQQQIKEALAQLAGEGGGAPVQAAAPVQRPPHSPAFDDASSYMAPNEIAVDQMQAQAQLPAMPAPEMGGTSAVTLADRAVAERPSSGGGFDWGRALWAAGGGDIGAFDANRQRGQERQDKQVADFDQKQLVRQAMDPQSSISKQRQAEYAQQMQSRAQIAAQSGMGELAKTFGEEAKRAGAMSATQIDRSSQSMGGLMKESLGVMDSMSRRDLAQQGQQYKNDMLQATIGNQGQQRAVDWAGLNLKGKEVDLRHKEREDALQAKKEAAEEKKGDKLPAGAEAGKQVELDEGLRKIARAEQLLASGKIRYLGFGADAMNTAMSKDPTGLLDKRNPEEKEFANLVAWIAAPARHELFGGSYTGSEKTVGEELFASIGRNKESVKQTLKTMKDGGSHKRKAMHTLYPGLDKLGGGTESAPPIVARAKEAMSDPEATPADRGAAQKILDKYGVK